MPAITLPPMKEEVGPMGESLKWLIEQIIPQLSFEISEASLGEIHPTYKRSWEVWGTIGQVAWKIKVGHPNGETSFTTYILQSRSQPAPSPLDTLFILIDDSRSFRNRSGWKELASDLGHTTQKELLSSQLSWEVMKVEDRQMTRFFPPEIVKRLCEADLDV